MSDWGVSASSGLPEGFMLRNGRYQIRRTLGMGGFGVTYEAWDAQLEIPVALKEFFPSGAYRIGDSVRFTGTQQGIDFGEAMKDFVREARLLARLRHPNIVALFDHFEEIGTGFMVMEFLNGMTYTEIVRTHGALREADALSVLRSVGEGLLAVHQASLTHRDVKPSNVMGTHDRGVVLIDFGASRVWSTASASVSKALVSDGFSPLEQYTASALSPASDVYALAATGYYLLTGEVPPSSTDRASGAASTSIVGRPGISSTVASAIERAMSLRVADRPQTVSEFLTDLTRPVRAEVPPTTVARLQREEPTQFAPPPPPKSSRAKLIVVLAAAAAFAGFGVVGVALSRSDGAATTVSVAFDADGAAGSDAPAQSTGTGTDAVPAQQSVPQAAPAPAPQQAPVVTEAAVNLTPRVPSVNGSRFEDAVAAVEQRGLTAFRKTESSSSVEAGFVVRTDPDGGTPMTRGETVVIIVSKGRPPAPRVTDAIEIPSGGSSGRSFESPQEFVRFYYLDLINSGQIDTAFYSYLTPGYQQLSGGWSGFSSYWNGRRASISSFGSCSWSMCTYYTGRGAKVTLFIRTSPSGPKFRGDAANQPID